LVVATATAELGGKLAFGRGLTTQVRPKKYFTIPKASLERLLDDVEQLINFFVIESQRVVFAENVYVTGAVSGKLSSSCEETLLIDSLTGVLCVPGFVFPHQVRPALGLDLDCYHHRLPRTPHLRQEQGGH
jgi:hypothetical protein